MLSVCFLWHMHQPYYVDPTTRTAVMPWVRLHAVKGYWDMVCLLEEFPRMHVSMNLTPVLVKQIIELNGGEVRDEWFELSKLPAASLSEEQRVHILDHFFKINWDNLIRPHPRYWQLLHKRGTDLRHVDLHKASRQWTEADMRDLQVWFNLAWCGYKACAMFPELTALKQKGQGFSEEDKATVLRVHEEILRRVLGKYRERSEAGQLELTTSPFFHPILPLVYDSDFARRCMPQSALPKRFSYPEDAREQIRLGVEQHEAVFGAKPVGLWPSEGSVCPELVPMMRDAGIRWFGTDEEIMFRSLTHEGIVLEKGRERLPLYRGHAVEFDGATVCAAFRDRSLSDFIGFSASRNNPELAVEFLLGHLTRIAEVAEPHHGMAPIILDGENAWEYFPDGGERFLRCLYGTLSATTGLVPVSFGEYFAAHAPTSRIRKLHTGSWIRADFDIWVGDPEENRAWELLGQARHHLEEQGGRVDPAAREKAQWEIYAAEGSDWFWWYGPDFQTDSDHLFDLLFRRHIENVYRALGHRPPDVLKARIRQRGTSLHMTMPVGLLRPTIDGHVTSFFEWQEAGRFEIGKNQSTMYRGDGLLRSIHFGFDLSTLYLRFDFEPKANPAMARLRVHLLEGGYARIECTLDERKCVLTRSADGGLSFDSARGVDNVAFGDIVELGIPLNSLGFTGGQRIAFFVEELRADVELGRHPEQGVIRMVLPGAEFELENWQV